MYSMLEIYGDMGHLTHDVSITHCSIFLSTPSKFVFGRFPFKIHTQQVEVELPTNKKQM